MLGLFGTQCLTVLCVVHAVHVCMLLITQVFEISKQEVKDTMAQGTYVCVCVCVCVCMMVGGWWMGVVGVVSTVTVCDGHRIVKCIQYHCTQQHNNV